MPSKMFEDFGAGVDRRRERSMTEPDKLWNLRNGYVDTGRRVRSRPGNIVLGTMNNCDGLLVRNGVLCTFAIKGTTFSAAAGMTVIELDAAASANTVIKKIWYADMFTQYPYVICEYGDSTIAHHYVDGTGTTRISDANCPQTKSATIVGNRVFAISAVGTVRFCALGLPKDWTLVTASIGAGFLPVTANQAGVGNPSAVSQYQSDLVVFFETGIQVWFPDVDSSAMFKRQSIYNNGTTAIRSTIPFGDELVYVAPYGVRSLSVTAQTNSRTETDIGSSIDDYPLAMGEELVGATYVYYPVYPRYPVIGQVASTVEETFGSFLASVGQLWLCWPKVNPSQDVDLADSSTARGSGSTAIAVLTYSRNAQLSSWSSYDIPYIVHDIADLSGTVFMLAATQTSAPYDPKVLVYDPRVQSDTLADGSTAGFTVDIDMPFLDFDASGVLKIVSGMDLIATPSADVSFRYSPNDETRLTNTITMTGPDTREVGMTPVELQSVAIAPRLQYTVNGTAFRFSGLQMYYTLGSAN